MIRFASVFTTLHNKMESDFRGLAGDVFHGQNISGSGKTVAFVP
jgi:hypothetical protein